jgi:hypothetical protein
MDEYFQWNDNASDSLLPEIEIWYFYFFVGASFISLSFFAMILTYYILFVKSIEADSELPNLFDNANNNNNISYKQKS